MNITHKLKIKASAETIYKAVSTTEGIKGWWAQDSQVGENVGEPSFLKFNKEGTIVPMDFRTDELVANKKTVWTCTKNGNPMWLETQLVTEITENGDHSEVVFSHTNFDDKFEGDAGFEMIQQGWNYFVESLTSYCESGEGKPW